MRRNALHRVAEANKGRLSLYGFRIDPDARLLYMPNREMVSFPERMTSAEIKSILVRHMRLIDESEKMTHDIISKKIQGKLI